MKPIRDFSGYWEADALTLCFGPASVDALTNLTYSELSEPLSWTDLLIGEEGATALGCLKSASRERTPFSFEAPIRTLQGEHRWIRVVGDCPGQNILRGYITDFTSTQFEESDAEIRHKELFEGVPLPLSVTTGTRER